jgi:hypothetical protein
MSRSKFEAMERKMIEVERVAREVKKLADKKGGQRGTPGGGTPVGGA